MKELAISESKKELNALCTSVRRLALAGEYKECERLISDAMGKYPHAAEPHNLFGVILEKEDDHIAAMKHFRAAWALNPSYFRHGKIWKASEHSFPRAGLLMTKAIVRKNIRLIMQKNLMLRASDMWTGGNEYETGFI